MENTMSSISHFVVEIRPFKVLRTIHPEPGETYGPIVIGSSDPERGDKFATVEKAQQALETARGQTVVESPRIVAVYPFTDGDGEFYRPII
jgi:hypothetical protein